MTLTNLPKNKKAILLKRPENEITDDLFEIIDEECIEPNDDELLIRVCLLYTSPSPRDS